MSADYLNSWKEVTRNSSSKYERIPLHILLMKNEKMLCGILLVNFCCIRCSKALAEMLLILLFQSRTMVIQLTAPNALCGRVIGRGGTKINGITVQHNSLP